MIPRLRLFAGPNGAGKTTLTQTIKNEYDISLGKYINPDEIALDLSKITDEVQKFHKAQTLAREERLKLIKNKQSMTYESVMSHESHLEFVTEANKKGFRSYLYYVGIATPEICIDRVATRVQEGGHDVPTEKIGNRYRRSLEHLYKMCKLMRRVYLFDNTGDKHVFVAEVNTSGELCLYQNEIKSVGGAPWLKVLINQWSRNMIKTLPHAPRL